jgi:phosphoribosylformimino-5-aminoimidazole carboxamide ribotide isomerase
MIVTPAVDLRDGKCVQLVGGSYEHQMVELDDAIEAADRWQAAGFRTLHVVDLDAATGRGSNRDLILDILHSTRATTQVGGGLRTRALVEQMLFAGADHVVVGTRAIEDRAWLEEIAAAFPQRIVVAMDVLGRSIVTHGWQRTVGRPFEKEIRELNELPLGGLLVTAVHKEGLMGGPDIALMREITSTVQLPVQASGGITSLCDLEALRKAGVSSAIVGMALYTGQLNPADIDQDMKG